MLSISSMRAIYSLMCFFSLLISSLALAYDAADKYQLQWITDDSQSAEFVKARIVINTTAERVWKVIRNPNHYSDWTTQVVAKTPSVQPGEPIEFWVDLNECCGKTYSSEMISVVDDDVHALAWEQNMGFGIHTQRWQFIIPSADGQSVTYYTGLKIPNPFGSTLNFFGTMKKLKIFLDGFSKALKEKSEFGLLATEEFRLEDESEKNRVRTRGLNW